MAKAVKVKIVDLEEVFEFASAGASLTQRAYIARANGHIYCVADASGDKNLPKDLDNLERYLRVPHKNDLKLGRYLVANFVRQTMPDAAAEVEAIFRRRGAYAQFKTLLQGKRMLEQWQQFETTANIAAMRQWCAENQVEIIEQSLQSLPPARPAQAATQKHLRKPRT